MISDNPLETCRSAMVSVLYILVTLLLPAAIRGGDNHSEKIDLFLQSHEQFRQGEELFSRKQMHKAAACLQRCLDLFPQHDRAHFRLAEIRLKQRRLAEAEIHIRAAKRSFLESREWYNISFRRYLDELRGKQMDNRLRLSILGEQNATASCGSRRAIFYKANAIRSQDSAIDAILAAFPPREKEVPAEYHYIHGNIHFLSGRHDPALIEYQRALEKNPEHGYACNNLANLYFLRKQYDRAREYLDRAEQHGARINPGFREALQKALAD